MIFTSWQFLSTECCMSICVPWPSQDAMKVWATGVMPRVICVTVAYPAFLGKMKNIVCCYRGSEFQARNQEWLNEGLGIRKGDQKRRYCVFSFSWSRQSHLEQSEQGNFRTFLSLPSDSLLSHYHFRDVLYFYSSCGETGTKMKSSTLQVILCFWKQYRKYSTEFE